MIGCDELFKSKLDNLKRLAKSLGVDEKLFSHLENKDKRKLVRIVFNALKQDAAKNEVFVAPKQGGGWL